MTDLIRTFALLIVFWVGINSPVIAAESFVHFERDSGDLPFAVDGQPAPLIFNTYGGSRDIPGVLRVVLSSPSGLK